MRLDKFLSSAAVAGRKEIKKIIADGRVSVGDIVVLDPGAEVEDDSKNVKVDGIGVYKQPLRVLMMNKPTGVMSVTKDATRRTVIDILPPEYRCVRFFPIGRLDMDTEGLILFTNSGSFADSVLRPERPIVKRYYARHHGTASEDDVEAFRNGIVLERGLVCRPAILEPIGESESYISVTQGKYHIVRRMMYSRIMHVNYLRRDSIGALKLGALHVGEVRELSPEEIELIFAPIEIE